VGVPGGGGGDGGGGGERLFRLSVGLSRARQRRLRKSQFAERSYTGGKRENSRRKRKLKEREKERVKEREREREREKADAI
jgi:hypothetical protein